jgi:hypothetical protein
MFKKLRYALLCFYIYYFVPIHYCDPELKPYKDELIQLTQQYCTNKQYNHPLHQYVYFKKLKGDEIGECVIKLHTYKIIIDPIFWKAIGENTRWQLITHEFAHCLLLKDHVDNKGNYMFPMYIPLSRDMVRNQFIQDVKEHCK